MRIYTRTYLLYITIKSLKFAIKLIHSVIIKRPLFLHISLKFKNSTKATNIFANIYNAEMTISPELMYYSLIMVNKFETESYVIAINDCTQGCVDCPCMYINLKKHNIELK
jgi:hypothetical protein